MPGLGIRGGILGDSWGGCSLVPTFSQLKLQGGERPAQTSLVPDLPFCLPILSLPQPLPGASMKAER